MTDWDQLERITALPKRRQPTKKRKHPEQSQQKKIADFLRWALIPPAWFTAVPGGALAYHQAKIWKGLGYRRGTHDIIIFALTHSYHVDIKAGSNDLTDEQKAVRELILQNGDFESSCRSVDEMKELLTNWRIPFLQEKPLSSVMRGMKVALGSRAEG